MRFVSVNQNYNITMKPDKKIIVGTEVVNESGINIKFQMGQYITEDKTIIAFLQKQIKDGNKRISMFDPAKAQRAAAIMAEATAKLKAEGLTPGDVAKKAKPAAQRGLPGSDSLKGNARPDKIVEPGATRVVPVDPAPAPAPEVIEAPVVTEEPAPAPAPEVVEPEVVEEPIVGPEVIEEETAEGEVIEEEVIEEEPEPQE